MEGTPSVARHLLQLGTYLASSRNHRAAALAFSTAARTSGISPRVQAYALYKSALHLQAATEVYPEPPTSAADRVRAVSQIRKCFILIVKQPASSNIQLQLTALLERIYSSSGDHLRAAKTINSGLACITTHPDRAHVLRWWVYFRGRAVRNALATGNSFHQAAKIASDSAAQCRANGDKLSAAAFYLANIQVLLSVRGNVRLDFEDPATCLREAEPGERQQLDVTMLSVGMHFLHTLSYLRLGKVGDARNLAIDSLLRAYEKLRAAHKANRPGSWHWFTAKVISAITNHCVSMIGRVERAERARTASGVALKRIGIQEGAIGRIEEVCQVCSITRPAARALAVSLLDSTARLHLAKLELPEAAKLIATATRFAFEDISDQQCMQRAELESVDLGRLLSPQLPMALLTIRCSVMLLFAEYHSLRGVLSGAQAAMRYLTTILMLPEELWRQNGEVWITDILQTALSHMSLLTGDDRKHGRPDLPVQDEPALSQYNFDNVQCYAIALLTMGICYMRRSMIIEAVGAMNGALRIALDKPTINAQIASNVLTIRSAPGLARQQYSDSPSQDIDDALAMAKELHDPVLLSRVMRQRQKMVERFNQAPEAHAEVMQMLRWANHEMTERQRNAGMILEQL